MRNKKNWKTKLLEKTPLEKLFHNLRTFFMLINRNVLLATPFYTFLKYYRLFQFSMCLLLTDLPVIWDKNPPFKNIFQFIQIFWRFSSNSTTETALTISFVVILIIFFALEFTVFGIFLYFIKTSSITKISSYIVCFYQEIVFPILISWVVSQMATVISLISIDSSYRSAFEYVQLVIYVLIFIYYVLYSNYFSNNDVNYMKGRSNTWSFRMEKIYIFESLVNLFFTRFIEMLPKTPAIVFTVIDLLYVAGFVFLLFYMLPFIDSNDNINHITCSISFLVGLVLQTVSAYGKQIDSEVVIIVVVALTIIMFIITSILFEKIRSKATETLRALELSEINFVSAFKKSNDFLLAVRFGFLRGNIYVFSWQPFLSAVDVWPEDIDIWIQWIRFVIIYPDQSKFLDHILREINDRGFKDMTTKNVKSQIKFIQKSRNKYMTPELKQEFNEIDEIITSINTLTITYWNEMSGGSLHSNSVYNIAVRLKHMIDTVDSKCYRLLSLYPNNYPVALKYSEFMENVVSDPVVGKFWKSRSDVLKGRNHIFTDVSQEYGFNFFPFIPHSIQKNSEKENESLKQNDLNNSNKRINSSPSILGNDQNANNNIADSKLIDSFQKNENNTSSSMTYDTQDNDDINISLSHIRNLGLNAKVPFVSVLIAISIIFFIIAFLLVPFFPPILIVSSLQPYRKQFDTLKYICDLRTSIIKEPYYMFFQALRSLNEMLASSFHPYDNYILNDEIIKLNKNADYFQKNYGEVIKIDSLSGKYINETKIKYIIGSKSTEISFMEGLSTIISHILHHDNPVGIYYEEAWFQFIFDNIEEIEHSLEVLSNLMCDDMNNLRDDSIKIISIILYIFIGIEVIFIPIFIYNTFQIRKNWNYIVNTINSIPRVAIQKVIEKYSRDNSKQNNAEESHQNFKSEFRYKLSLAQMVSSRDTSGGLPIKSIITIFLIDFIISIVCIVAVILLMNVLKKDLTNVPLQYYTVTNGIYAIFKFISVFLIKGYIDFRNAIPVMMNISKVPSFDASFGKYNHQYINNGIIFVSDQMLTSLDEVIFGSSDNSEKGILYSSKDILKLLIQKNGNPFGDSDRITMIDLEKFPYFAGLGLFYESNLRFVEQGLYNPNFNAVIAMVLQTFDMSTIFDAVKLGTYTLVPKFLEAYVNKTDELFNHSMDKTNLILFLLAAGLFVIGLFAISWLIVIISRVKKIVQFCLSLLSMIDSFHVQEMQNVMNLFYGTTSGNIQTNQALQRAFNEIESLVPECPIEINNQMIITSINDKLIEEWDLDREQVIGSHINLIMTFNDDTIFDKLAQQANGQSKCKDPKHYDTTITLNASKKVFNVSFTSYYVPRNKDVKLVLMFGDKSNQQQDGKSIDEMNEENNEIIINAVPSHFRSKINIEAETTSFSSNYLIFCGIQILNFNEFFAYHTPKDIRQFKKEFENQIKNICEDKNYDATYIKNIGNIYIIGFNFIHQITNFYKSSQESYEVLKTIFSFANKNGYEIKAVLTSAKSAKSALLSKNTLKFDVYSNEIRSMLNMLRSCQKNQILYSAKMKDFMPPNITSNCEEAEILNFNEESEWGYKIFIE